MLSGYHLATARRVWFVPDFVVWGKPSVGDLEYLATETIDGVTSVMFGSASVDGAEQHVQFTQLVDHRGNHLPSTINAARVFPRSNHGADISAVGTETDSGFKIAGPADSSTTVTTDLLIIELGD